MITSQLNKTVVFQRKTTVTNSVGTPTDTWLDDFTTYAGLYIRSGNTVFNERYTIVTKSVEWTIRYNENVGYKHRIKYNNQFYKITFIEEIGRKEALKITTVLFEDDE